MQTILVCKELRYAVNLLRLRRTGAGHGTRRRGLEPGSGRRLRTPPGIRDWSSRCIPGLRGNTPAAIVAV